MKVRAWNAFFAMVLILAFFVLLYLPLSSPVGVFNTPDENANYFFAKTFAERGELSVIEPLEPLVDNVIHPRGVNVVRGFLVPESFLGLPIFYGGMIRLLAYTGQCQAGSAALLTLDCGLPAILAFLNIVALFCLLKIFKFFFEKTIARLALLFVLTNSIFLYWSGRPFMHNILFLDLVVIGWGILLVTVRSKIDTRWDMVAGLILGAAIAVRPAEIVWVSISTLAIILMSEFSYASADSPSRKRRILALGQRCFKAALGGLIILVSLLFFNRELYGNFFGSGYSTTESNIVVAESAVPQLARVSLAEQIFLPFGFHPLEAFSRFSKYALGGLWWYTAPMLLGAVIVMALWCVKGAQAAEQKARRYALTWLMVSMYLIIYYGAFRVEIFADPRHPLGSSIGTPYLRYWLPIFVFGAPFAAMFLLFFYRLIISILRRATPYTQVKRFLTAFGMTVLVVLMTVLSLRAVFWQGTESWLNIKNNLFQFAEIRERAERTTNENTIFFVPHFADRIYFPKRRVVVDVAGKDTIQILGALVNKDYPVFWLRGRGEILLKETDLKKAGLRLLRRFDVDPKGKIYQVIKGLLPNTISTAR